VFIVRANPAWYPPGEPEGLCSAAQTFRRRRASHSSRSHSRVWVWRWVYGDSGSVATRAPLQPGRKSTTRSCACLPTMACILSISCPRAARLGLVSPCARAETHRAGLFLAQLLGSVLMVPYLKMTLGPCPPGRHAVARLWAGSEPASAGTPRIHSFPSGHTADIVISNPVRRAVTAQSMGRWRVPGLGRRAGHEPPGARQALPSDALAGAVIGRGGEHGRAALLAAAAPSGAPRLGAGRAVVERRTPSAELAVRNTSRYNGRMFRHRFYCHALCLRCHLRLCCCWRNGCWQQHGANLEQHVASQAAKSFVCL